MKDKIIDTLKNSLSYEEYRKQIVDLLAVGKSTGKIQSNDFLNYSRLNNSRMKRLDKTFRLSDKHVDIVQNLPLKYIWIVLTEGWCGDAAHSLPIMNKISEASKHIDLRIALRDENEELMNEFLTDGSKSIPKLIIIDAGTNKVIGSWGPRPSEATKMVNEYKENYGSLDPQFKKDLQVWYNTNKGVNITEDMLGLLCATVDCV